MLLLMGDFLKHCSGMSEKTPSGSRNPLIPIYEEMWPFLAQVIENFS
jgi:hypothetical protein